MASKVDNEIGDSDEDKHEPRSGRRSRRAETIPCEEIQDKNCPFEFQHTSFVKSYNDFKFESCPNEDCPCTTKQHCTLCASKTVGRSKAGNGFRQLKRHMTQFHWNKAVKHKGWHILPCNLSCVLECHYHCPHCEAVIKPVSQFETHVIKCDKGDTNIEQATKRRPNRWSKMSNQHEPPDDMKKNRFATESSKILTENDRKKHIQHVKELTGENYHLSMVCAFGDLKTLKGADKRYRCPLCTDLLFPPTDSLAKVEKHFTTQHWFKKIPFKDIYILRCLLNCYELSAKSEESHWHCPLCPRFNMVRRRVEEHLQSHHKGTWHHMLSTMRKEDVEKVVYKTEDIEETPEETPTLEKECEPDDDTPTSTSTTISPVKQSTAKPKEVFQMMAAVVDPDFLELIPGNPDFFFRKLETCLGINYTNAGPMCLIQGRLESVQEAQSILEEIRQKEPNTESELDQIVVQKLGSTWSQVNIEETSTEATAIKSPEPKAASPKGKATRGKSHTPSRRGLSPGSPKQQTKASAAKVSPSVRSGRVVQECSDYLESDMNNMTKRASVKSTDKERRKNMENIGELNTPKREKRENRLSEEDIPTDYNERRSARKRKVNPHVEAFLKGKPIKIEPEEEEQHSDRSIGEDETGQLKRKLSETRNDDLRHDGNPKRSKVVKTYARGEKISSSNDFVATVTDGKIRQTAHVQIGSQELESSLEDENLESRSVAIDSASAQDTVEHGGNTSDSEYSKPTIQITQQIEPQEKKKEIHLSNFEEILNAEPKSGKLDSNQSSENPKFNVLFDQESGSYQLTMSIDSNTSSTNTPKSSSTSRTEESEIGLLSQVDEKLRDDSRTVYTCPACQKQFLALPKFYKHIVGTNCTNIMLKGTVKVPEEIKPFIEKAGKVGDTNECPNCKKKLYCIEAARVHYVEDACAKQFHPKTNPYKFQYDEVLRHFKCRHCTYTNASAFQVNLHEKRKHVDRTIQCKLCERKFSTIALLRIHIQTSHQKVKKTVICDICGDTVIQRYMKRHRESKHDPMFKLIKAEKRKLNMIIGTEKQKQFKCSQCSYESCMENQVRNHEIRIHGEKTIVCTEEGCNKMFAIDNDMRAHVKSVHKKIGNALEMEQCPVCKKSMLKKNVNQHVRQVHHKVRNFICPICQISFGTKHVLRMHLETHKPQSARYSKFLCPHCGKGFVNKISYQEHVNVHTGLRPYRCEICQKNYRHKSVFQRHLDSHKVGSLKKEHFCSYCGNGFCTKRSLYTHMKRHEGIEIECVCGQKFFSNAKMLLERHQSSCVKWQEILTQETEEVAVIMADAQAADGTETILVLPPDQAPHSTVLLQTVAEDGTFEETEVLVDTKDLQDIQNVIDQYPQATAAKATLQIDQNGELESNMIESEAKYQCGHCDSMFITMDEVQEHMMALHVDSGIKLDGELLEVSEEQNVRESENSEVVTINVVEGQDGGVMQQIVEQLEDGTVQILDQPVQMVDGDVQYVTENHLVVQQQEPNQL